MRQRQEIQALLRTVASASVEKLFELSCDEVPFRGGPWHSRHRKTVSKDSLPPFCRECLTDADAIHRRNRLTLHAMP